MKTQINSKQSDESLNNIISIRLFFVEKTIFKYLRESHFNSRKIYPLFVNKSI